MHAPRLLAATLVCSAALAGLTACGPTDAKKSTDAAAQSAAAAPSKAPALGDLTAAEIIKKGQEASARATSVKLTFDLTSEGLHLTGAVAQDATGNCVGQVTYGDKGSFDLLRTGGKIWLKPDAKFWQVIAPEAAKAGAGKYLAGDANGPRLKDLATFCDLGLESLKKVGKNDDGTDDTAGAVKGAPKQVGSLKAVVVTDAADGEKSEVAFAAEGEPYLLQLSITGKEPSTMTFSDFQQPVTVTAPAAAQVIDAAKYLKG
ncbi:hypothetical protein [Kitasatospora terrestris]|uniref:Lipoprotein n=1 Tax=Kitasatospora terrestris TaxID=258051 RepID=A0ABP9DLY4_9ACTN